MQCFIYKSLRKQQLYLYIRNKDDFSSVPKTLLESLGKLELVLDLKLTPECKLAKENAAKVIAALSDKGYFVQLPPTDAPAPARLQ
jgi:uncharacterized protein YcgL (UPF0745 family)